MKWRLDVPHYIAEQILPPGTLIGDDTEFPFLCEKEDKKIGRKVGDPLPPSTGMTPMDEEARAVWRKKFGDEPVERDPLKAIPLTGAQGAPTVKPAAAPRPGVTPEPRQPEPAPPKTGMLSESEKKVVGAGAEPTPKPGAEGPKPTSTSPATPTPKV